MGRKTDTSPARGMRDVLPAEVELRDHAREVILATYRRFGYSHIETPALETIERLTGSEGGENEKLIYKVLKRGDKLDLTREGLAAEDLVDLGLRYDLTVPLARFYARHHAELPRPFKAIQVGPVWRAERPQKGRYRQFTQCDIDVLGEAGALAEVDLLAATTEALAALGLSDFQVRLNDRRVLTKMASRCGLPPERHDEVFIAVDKADKIGWDGVGDELVGRGLDAGPVGELVAALRDGDPTALDDGPEWAALGEIARDVEGQLGAAGTVTLDPTLVRGMGYYTGPIFEVGVEGLPHSIAGGGRYDRMVGRMLGTDVPACGFSIGFERVVALLQEQREAGRSSMPSAPRRVAVLCEGGEHRGGALEKARALRTEGFWASLVGARPAKKRGKQLDELQRHGFDGWIACGPGAAEGPRWFEERDRSPGDR